MKDFPAVAICIPTYNQAPFLRQAVESALGQSYPNVEVWVGDDASTDGTREIMQELMRKFPAIRYHRHLSNVGLAENNNWLFQQPSTEFIVRLDSDDILDPDYVRVLTSALSRYPGAAYGHAAVREIDENGVVQRIRQLARREEYQDNETALRKSASGYRVAANICMFRSRALREAGFYRKMDFAEDWDLSVRLADLGWGNVYCDQLLGSYRVWTDKGNVRPKRKASELRGCISVFEGSLSDAFRRRGWDLCELQRNRQSIAIVQALSLCSKSLTAAERADIRQLVTQLDGSYRTALQLALVQSRIAPILPIIEQCKLRLRDAVKAAFRRFACC